MVTEEKSLSSQIAEKLRLAQKELYKAQQQFDIAEIQSKTKVTPPGTWNAAKQRLDDAKKLVESTTKAMDDAKYREFQEQKAYIFSVNAKCEPAYTKLKHSQKAYKYASQKVKELSARLSELQKTGDSTIKVEAEYQSAKELERECECTCQSFANILYKELQKVPQAKLKRALKNLEETRLLFHEIHKDYSYCQQLLGKKISSPVRKSHELDLIIQDLKGGVL